MFAIRKSKPGDRGLVEEDLRLRKSNMVAVKKLSGQLLKKQYINGILNID